MKGSLRAICQLTWQTGTTKKKNREELFFNKRLLSFGLKGLQFKKP